MEATTETSRQLRQLQSAMRMREQAEVRISRAREKAADAIRRASEQAEAAALRQKMIEARLRDDRRRQEFTAALDQLKLEYKDKIERLESELETARGELEQRFDALHEQYSDVAPPRNVETDGRRNRFRVDPDAVIRVTRSGTAPPRRGRRATLYALYEDGMTVQEWMSKAKPYGGGGMELRQDLSSGLITLEAPGGSAPRRQKVTVSA